MVATATKILLNNLGILFYVLFIYTMLLRYSKNDIKIKLLYGLLWSVAVVASMLNTFNIAPGVYFDSRSVILILSGMFGGPVVVSVPTLVSVAFRINLGGEGVLPGTITILAATAAGLYYYYWRRWKKANDKFYHYYLTGLSAHLVYFFAAFLLPMDKALFVMKGMIIPVVVLYPIATAVFAMFMVWQERYIRHEHELVKANDRLTKSEDETSAANQQLRAANQQLAAANQQLAASNQQIRASEQQLRAAQEELKDQARIPMENPGIILKVDLGGKVLFNNSSSHILLEHLKITNNDLELPSEWKKKVIEVFEGGKLVKDEVVIGERFYSIDIFPVVDHKYILIYGMDITEKVLAERSLQTSEENYRELVENVNSAIVKWNVDGVITFINTYALELFGYTKDGLVGESVEKLVPDIENTGRELKGLVYDILAEPEKYKVNDNENICKDGRRVWMRWSNKAITNDNGEVVEIFAVGVDVTEKKQAEELIRNYNLELEGQVEERTSELKAKNQELEREVSERIAAERQLKETQSKMIESEKMVSIGRLAAGIAHELNSPLGAIGSTNTVMTNFFKKHIKGCDCRNEWYSKYSDKISGFIDYLLDNETIILSSSDKRSRRRELESKLDAAGVTNVHNTAAFLVETGIGEKYEDYLDILKDPHSNEIITYMDDVANILQGLTVIDSAVKQSSRISFALREYARDSDMQDPEIVDVKKTIETSLVLYGNKIKHGIDLTLNFGNVHSIEGYPNQLIQVWANLIHNSIQAMDGKGSLKIDLYEKDLMIYATIEDSGCGIPLEVQGNIFDPLFTTKPVGVGTGLGLDISKRIVARHGGTICFESTPGKGTIFTVMFPVPA